MQGGPWVPSVTIFHGGKGRRVNVAATINHVVNLQKHGARGVIVNGTTGEGHLLKHEDKLRLIAAAGELQREGVLKKDFMLITGTGTENVAEALEILAAANSNGFHAALVLPPKNKEKMSFYQELAESNLLPILVYNHPRLHPEYSFSPTDLGQLMKAHHTIVGVKDSSGDKKVLHEWLTTVRKISDRDPLLAIGEDYFVQEGLAKAGATAAIAGAANTKPGLKHLINIFRHHHAGDLTKAAEAQVELDKEIDLLLKKGVFRDNAKKRRLK